MNKHFVNTNDATNPLTRLLLAINCYISTGDHLGVGVFTETSGVFTISILRNRDNAQDCADFDRLKSRLDEIETETPGLFLWGIADTTAPGDFDVFPLDVGRAGIAALTRALRSKPGRLGFGSMKPLVDKHYPALESEV